jgi:dipeptidyl aminopeptidase/acylaminoacyl peptidase
VYAVGESELRYLDPSVDSDAEPVWAPDSHRVAFIRIATSQTATAFGPKRAAETPWSIRVADVDTCQGREIWRAEPKQGSEFYALDAPHQLLWADGDRIVFPWERTGYQHLYTIALAGGAAHELTPGVFEVESAALSPDRKSVVYASNQDDIDRRHVWRVMLDGSPPRRLTKGSDIEWSAALPAGNDVAIFRSDATHPAHASIITASGVRDLRPDWLPTDFPLASLVEPEPVLINADPRPAVPPARRQIAAPGRDLLPWRIAPSDAARLALHAVLSPGLRLQSVSG